MKLISSVNEYKVINLIKRDPRYCVYKCVSKGRGYLLYLIGDEQLEKALVTRFADVSGSDFDGFAELFSDGGGLVLAFKDNILEETAADYLGDDTNEIHKLLFFERVLEALCVHEVPSDIACDLLEYDNIGVKSDGSSDCRYILHNFSAFDSRGMNTLSEIFARKLTRALLPVGRTERTPVTDKFCKELCANPPETMTDLYDRYIECVETCRGIDSGETKIQRLKKKALKATSIGKVILMAVILGMACFILIMSIVNDDSGSGEKFRRIGDVIIEETSSQN